MRKFPDWLLFLIGYCSLYTQQWTTANRENLWKARSLNLLLLSSSRSSTPTFVLCNSNSSPSVEQWGIPVGLHCVCVCGYQMCTMLVSYMSRVEAFVTGIKIESSDQTLFESRSRDQGYLRTVKIKESTPIWPLTHKNQATKSFWRDDQAHFLLLKNLDHSRKCFNRRHTSDYPLLIQNTRVIRYCDAHHFTLVFI